MISVPAVLPVPVPSSSFLSHVLLFSQRVMNFSGRDPFVIFDVSGGTLPVFDMLSRGIHRVLIQNRSGDIYGSVSQFDLVAKIHQLRYDRNISKMLNSISVKDLFPRDCKENQILGTTCKFWEHHFCLSPSFPFLLLW
jgi:hypothetical protein